MSNKSSICTIGLEKFCSDLNLTIIHPGSAQFELYDSAISRPGLQLHGFYDFFDVRRIQIFGKAEMAYLKSLDENARAQCLDTFFAHDIPCCIVCWGMPDYTLLEEAAQKYNRPLLVSQEKTIHLVYRLVDYVDYLSAPSTRVHGVLVEVHGVGVVITGPSGIGKSETALELIKRGNSFIADDSVDIILRHGNTLIGQAPEVLRYFMEVRGIGIIDVALLFGAQSIKRSVGIDMFIRLENWDEHKAYDRLGLDEETTNILGIEVPLVTIPVSGGRNISGIIEAAAINNRMKAAGLHSAQIFCDKIEKYNREAALEDEKCENI